MKICFICSLAIKQKAFSEEKEFRIVFFSTDPDARTDWHEPRKILAPTGNFPFREYLPLSLGKLGFQAKKYK
jgi:hypothetical protein